MDIISSLFEKGISFLSNEPMASHTTFRTGGAADFFLDIQSEEDLRTALSCFSAFNIPVLVIGNGSNILITDKGYRGAVLHIGSGFSAIRIDGTKVTAQAGAPLAAVVSSALNSGLTGLEFAGGIPGSVGGALYMNAGAYGGELSQYVVSARVLRPDGSTFNISKEDMDLSYRHSLFMGSDNIILDVTFELTRGDVEAARKTLSELNARRRSKQPLEYPSAGSTFTRPKGYYAGALIEAAQLKGARFGGAKVSEKHAGFIVNCGGATSSDILRLIAFVQQTVFAKYAVWLTPEVQIVGER